MEKRTNSTIQFSVKNTFKMEHSRLDQEN